MPHVVVLPETTRRDDIDTALQACELRLVNLIAASATHPRQVVALSRDGRRAATFVEDPRLAVQYALVDGDGASELANSLATKLGSVSWQDVEARANEAWAVRHAVAFQDPARASELVARALAHDDAQVRAVAAVAAAYVRTPMAAVETALGLEVDARVRPLLSSHRGGFVKLRPRLAEHAMIRRHLVDGVEKIVVHHAGTGSLVTLDERAAKLALLADGTRDRDGIALAAARAGVYRRASEIAALFAALDEHDLLADGIEPGPVSADNATQWMTPTHRETPLRILDYRFRCTGGGGACCSQYASIPLTAEDARRLRKQPFTALSGDEDGSRIFLPFYGGVRTERVAMTLVDGKCLQLDARGKCTVHGGKPTACRIYPATFADDGESIRVSCGVECDCVLTSLDTPGEPLIDETWKTASDLPAGITIRVVPDAIQITPGATAPRRDVVRFTDAAEIGEDAVRACIRLALHLETHGVSAAVKDVAAEALQDLVLAQEILPAVERIARTMKDAAEAADAWRSEKDRTRRLRRALATASETMLARGLDASVAARNVHPKAEVFALRAALFGHLLADGRPMNEALRDFGARLLIARELAMSGARDLGHPVAAVMAAIRGAG